MTRCWSYFVALITVCCLVQGLPYISLPDTKGIDVHGVVRDTEASRLRRSLNGFPPSISVDLSSNGQNTHLDLEQNPSITDNVPVLLMHDHRIKKYRVDLKEKVAFYEDRAHTAAIMVSRKSDNEFRYFGTFVNAKDEYLIQPDVEDKGYTISRLHEELAPNMDFEINPNLVQPKRQASTNQTSYRHKRQDINYQVEIFFVIDYSIYNFWYEQTSGETNRHLATVSHITQFYAFVLDAINVRYGSVIVDGYNISCIYAGIYIANNEISASFVKNNVLDLGLPRPAFLASVVLSDFRDWAESNLSNIYGYDVAMMFTRYDMGTAVDGVFSHSTAGLAYRPGACTTFRYSINEDRFGSGMATVAAHELGHNLNASHDNRSANACNEDDGYIMAPSSGTSSNSSKNLLAYEFSSCSMAYFDGYITSMNGDETNCLISKDANYDTSDMDPFLDDLAGQVLSPDRQCEETLGNGSFLYRRYFSDTFEDICAILPCAKPDQITSYSIYMAWEGTSCGDGKICKGGTCMPSSSAPSFTDPSCLFGDAPYNVPFSNPPLPCAGYLVDASYHCYDSTDRLMCCETCEAISQDNIELNDCEYGDKAQWCATLALGGCYNNGATCCKSCPERALNITDCEYGDKAGWCDTLSLNYCYTNEDTCCKSCPERALAIPDCPYGDTYSECQKESCPFYTDPTGCCETCYEPTITTSSAPTTTQPTSTATSTTLTTTSTTPTTTTTTPTTTSTTPTTTSTNPTTTSTTPTTTSSTSRLGQDKGDILVFVMLYVEFKLTKCLSFL